MLHHQWLHRIIRGARRSPAEWLYQHGPSTTLSLPLSWPFFIIIASALMVAYIWGPLPPLPPPLPSIRIVQLFLFLALALFLLKGILRLKGLDWPHIGFTHCKWTREALIGLIVSVPTILALMVNNSLAGSPPRLDWVNALDNFSSNQLLRLAEWVLTLAVQAVVVGIVEEAIYRGWITTFLLTRLNSRELALWISAVIFGLGHFNQGLKGIMITMVSGYCFGLLYIWRKNLTVAIVVHAVYDFCLWLGVLGKTSP